MKKLLYMFPGVGSQYTGMGKSFFDNFKSYKDTFEEASDIVHQDLVKICFSPDCKEELFNVKNSQLTVFVSSIGIFNILKKEKEVSPDYCMGHSLGEYSALCSAGIISFANTLKLIKIRGEIINEISSSIDGTMMWVINLQRQRVEKICEEFKKNGKDIYISCFDSPDQTSISGKTEFVIAAARKMEKEGAIVYPLKLSGPYHSPLMKKARERMRTVLMSYQFNDPEFPVMANYNAQPYDGKNSVIENLTLQLISPIRWQDSIKYLIKQGVTLAVETGVKDVLNFLMKKNTQKIDSYSIDNMKNLNDFLKKITVQEDEYPEFIGKCLGIATSTKNRSENNSEYKQKVIMPYKKIEQIYTKLIAGKKSISEKEIITTLRELNILLKNKKVPKQERLLKMKTAFGDKLHKYKTIIDC